MSRKFDLIVFGATGLTGKWVIHTILKVLEHPSTQPFTWAVAGRSTSKLDEVLAQVGAQTGKDLNYVEKIIASTSDQDSLRSMARLCKVLLNCVGPYMLYGEQVVQACIAEGTHHVDASGEPPYLEEVQWKYHEEAEKKGVYIVGGCAFYSLPSDCGAVYLSQKFQGDMNSISQFVDIKTPGAPLMIHYATWHSIVERLAGANELEKIRAQLYPEPLPKPKYQVAERGQLHKSELIGGWAIPSPVPADITIMTRTQRHFYQKESKTPIHIGSYMRQESFFAALIMVIAGIFVAFLSQFGWGRRLLLKYPEQFSFGNVTREDPTPEQLKDTEYTVTLFGEGWSDHVGKDESRTMKPNKTRTLKVKGKGDPTVGATCLSLLQAALSILRESDKMPSKGGVYTPGAAFAKTTIIERLNRHGMKFEIEN